jgi:tetratricopeptide (TPR) repeat protein
MKSTVLGLSAICVLLLLFSFSARYVAAIEVLGEMINAGNYDLDHGNYSEAIAYFNKILQSYPANYDALTGKAYALVKLQMYDKATACLDKVLKIYPHDFNAIYYKAVALTNLGKYHEAQFYYDQLQKMAPKFPLTEKDLQIIHGRYTVPFHTVIVHK